MSEQTTAPRATRHTPGPWVWRWKSGSLHQVGTDRPYGATVLQPTYSYDEGVGVEISDADDRLIAAAPTLLALLQDVVDDMMFNVAPSKGTMDKIREAIDVAG